MNRYQPSANSHAVEQRIDERRAAAANYRLAKQINEKSGPSLLTSWRCAIGNRLISAGETLRARRVPRLPTG